MAVPDFQTLMLPLLRLAGDGQEHTLAEAIERLADEFKLSPAERKELLPSGRQSRMSNRVGWCKSYFKKAGLLQETGRGRFRITDRGKEVLASKPKAIGIKYLEERFPEVVEFRKSDGSGDAAEASAVAAQPETPEEILEASYQALRRSLAKELLDRIKACSPAFFEKLVVDLLVAMGYGGTRRDAGQAVGGSGDGGIDGIIKEDLLGLDAVYIQAKRWENTVGRPVVQGFAGSLSGHARKGVLITTSTFSKDARDFVERTDKKIVLIDGDELTQLMIDHGIGVADVAAYSVKKVDLDYFGEDE